MAFKIAKVYAQKDSTTGRFINPVTQRIEQPSKSDKFRKKVRAVEIERYGSSGNLLPEELRQIEEELKVEETPQFEEKPVETPKPETKPTSGVSYVDVETGKQVPAPQDRAFVKSLTGQQLTTEERVKMENVVATKQGLPILPGSPTNSAMREFALARETKGFQREKKQLFKEIADKSDLVNKARKQELTEEEYNQLEPIVAKAREISQKSKVLNSIYGSREKEFEESEKGIEQSEARLNALRSVVPLVKDNVSRRVRKEITAEQTQAENLRNIQLGLSGQLASTTKTDFSKTEEQKDIIVKNENLIAQLSSKDAGLVGQVGGVLGQKASEGIHKIVSYDKGLIGSINKSVSENTKQLDRDIARLERQRADLIVAETVELNPVKRAKITERLNKVDEKLYGSRGDKVVGRTTGLLGIKGRREGAKEFIENPRKVGMTFAAGLGIGAALPLIGGVTATVGAANPIAGAITTGTVKGLTTGAVLAYGSAKATEYGAERDYYKRQKLLGDTVAEVGTFTLGTAMPGYIAGVGRVGAGQSGIKARKVEIPKIQGTSDNIYTLSFEGYSGAKPLLGIKRVSPTVSKLGGKFEQPVTEKQLEKLPFKVSRQTEAFIGTPKVDFKGVSEYPLSTSTNINILEKNVKLSKKQQVIYDSAKKLSTNLQKTKSAFNQPKFEKEIVETLNSDQVLISLKNTKLDRGRVFGSLAQRTGQTKEQFIMGRSKETIGDIDKQLWVGEGAKEKSAIKETAQLQAKKSLGQKVRYNKEEGIIETYGPKTKVWRHAVDIKSKYGTGDVPEKFFGMNLLQPAKKVEGIYTQQLSEQALRKTSSVLTLRSGGSKDVVKELQTQDPFEFVFSPKAHRAKDIGDMISVDNTLIKSKGTKGKELEPVLERLKEQFPEAVKKPKQEVEGLPSNRIRAKPSVVAKNILTASVGLSASRLSRSKVSPLNRVSPSSFSRSKISSTPKSLSPSISMGSSKSPLSPPSKSPSISYSPSVSKSGSYSPSISPSISTSPSPSISPSIYPSLFEPPNIIIPGGTTLPGGALFGEGGRSKRKKKIKRKTTPSLNALLFGITGRPTKIAIRSGVGTRPIIIKKERKSRRNKK